MCTYNGGRYLREQLQSISAQTYSPSELIVCDDGSTDGTREIVSIFSREVSFPVHYYENSTILGSTKNFEQALLYCTGDAIALCDQDDIWFPEKLAHMNAVLEAEPETAGVFSNASLIDENGALLSGDLWQRAAFTMERQKNFTKAEAAYDLIGHDTVTGAAFMFRASYLPQIMPIAAEWIHDGWIAMILASCAELRPLAECLMSYRLHQAQQVGIRVVPWYSHLSTRRADALASHQLLAKRLAAMAKRLETLGAPSGITAALRHRASFYEERAAMFLRSRMARSFYGLRLLPGYFRYQKGFRSLFRDLLH